MTNIQDKEYELLLKRLEDEHQFALSKISHEIRNPVTLIHSFLQLIESMHPEVADFKYWSETKDNMDFLISLLEELSNFNNSKRLYLQSVNLHRLLTSIIDQITPSLSSKNITLTLEKETALPLMSLDTTKIKEAFLNLIRNAIEAIGSNGTIHIILASDGDVVTLAFSNNGPCIPQEYINTLFDPFVTHKKEGTGLGLAITKNVIEAHNGTITVTSLPNLDTTFTITLPV